MIPYTPDNTNRPAITSTQISLTNGSVVVASSVGTIVDITIKAASTNALLFAFDNATTATGAILSPNTNVGAPLAAGLVLNYGVGYSNGLTILVGGTVSATVRWYPG